MVTGNTHTRFITRGSTAFMAPEILLNEELLEFAGIDEMKKIYIWALLMTMFLVINPDQTHLLELSINESRKNITGKVFVTSADQQLKGLSSRKEFPLFSPSYEKEQSFH